MVKEEINLLKLNKEKEDARYWALKKQINDWKLNLQLYNGTGIGAGTRKGNL
jgi:hypothetical protein